MTLRHCLVCVCAKEWEDELFSPGHCFSVPLIPGRQGVMYVPPLVLTGGWDSITGRKCKDHLRESFVRNSNYNPPQLIVMGTH